MLDFATCTECGRCQSACPAWNTDKPLSPKLLIMDLRDNMFASATPLLRTGEGEQTALVPNVIDPDVLWSCTTCGACVNECPVDIEHIDAIVDMRRYQVLMESEFPSEAGLMLRNVENQGDPWGLGQAKRTEWTQSLDFEIPVITGHHPRRHRVPLLGRLRRRPRRAGPQGRPGHGAHAAPGRRHLRHPRAQGVLHRRPGAPPGQRVPLPGAGAR